jgi:1,4-alpha-glucan branching enzyme
MLKRTHERNGEKVTFALVIDQPVSVVGDFNEWDPSIHPMAKRANGTRSVAVELPAGRYAFRYLAADGSFFDDETADTYEPNGYGDIHGVLMVASAVLAAIDGEKVKGRRSGAADGVVAKALKRAGKLTA